jgi:hypothetical protein
MTNLRKRAVPVVLHNKIQQYINDPALDRFWVFSIKDFFFVSKQQNWQNVENFKCYGMTSNYYTWVALLTFYPEKIEKILDDLEHVLELDSIIKQYNIK